MDKTLTIPCGHERKEINLSMVRKAQNGNLYWNTDEEDKWLVDAVLSYFVLNCMTVTDKEL